MVLCCVHHLYSEVLKQSMMSDKCFTWFCWSCCDVSGIKKRLLQIIDLSPLNSLEDIEFNGSSDIKLHPDKSIQLKGGAAFFFGVFLFVWLVGWLVFFKKLVLNILPCI